MSDSEPDRPLVAPRPSDKDLTQALRDVVAGIFKSGKMEELTVKRVRLAAEKKLGIEEGFFKDNGDWKKRSDQIIKEEAEAKDQGSEEPITEKPIELPNPLPKPTKTKRSGPGETPKSRKRQKAETPELEDEEKSQGNEEESEKEEEEVKEPAKKQSKAPPRKPKPKLYSSKNEGYDRDSADEQDTQPSKVANVEQQDASESEMSVVFDEEPEPSKPPKSKNGSSEKSKKAATTKKSALKTKDADQDPDQAEVKRLQGWLVKCGIRKVWSKELASYETPKARIKHLKEMLADAGMKGRYSQEKARQIREERELKADLQMVQEGAKRWGTGSPEAAESDSGPRRRLNRGRKSLAFLDEEDDGEETD